jgi:hypothetical protein
MNTNTVLKSLLIFIFAGLLQLSGCSLFDKVTVEDDKDEDTATTGDIDTDTGPDYWVDGYCPEPVDGKEQRVSGDCNEVPYQGCCDDNGNVIYCYNNDLYCKPCAPQYVCSWYTGDTDLKEPYYWCTADDNGADTAGTFPQSCIDYNGDSDTADTDTVDTDTTIVVIPECTKEPFYCNDIHPTDTDLQILGCCWHNIAHYCKNDNVYFIDCATHEGTRCEANLFSWPPQADCIAPAQEPPSDPFNCGGEPQSCEDISPGSYLQLFGCCEGNTRWLCNSDISTVPIEEDCDTAGCGITFEEFVDTDSISHTLGYMSCRQ